MTLSRRQLGGFAAGVLLAGTKHAKSQTAPIRIGVVGVSSGRLATHADDLTGCIELAGDWINERGGIKGRKIDIIQGDIDRIVNASDVVEQLVGQYQVDILTGTIDPSIAIMSSEIALNYGRVFLETNSPELDLINRNLPNFIRTGPSSDSFAKGSVQAIRDFISQNIGLQAQDLRIWIEYDGTTFGRDVSNQMKKLLDEEGIQATMGTHSRRVADATAAITQARAAEPHVWVHAGTSADTGNLLLQAHKQGFKPPVMMMVASGDTAEALNILGRAFLEGILVVTYPRADINRRFGPGAGDFLTMYRAKFNREPLIPQAMSAFVGMRILFDILKEIDEITYEAVGNAAAKIDLPEGTYETGYGVKFDKRLQNTRALPVIAQWQGGKLRTVSPAYAASDGVRPLNFTRQPKL